MSDSTTNGKTRIATWGWLVALFVIGALLLPLQSDHLTLRAQTVDSIPGHDTKGTKFWVTFLEGRGGGGWGEQPDLRLFLSAIKPTTATIVDGRTGRQETIQLPVPHQSFEVNVTQLFGPDLELNGVDRGVSKKNLYIESEEEITVYGSSVRWLSSDAFLALPDDVLTRRYILLSYPNGYLKPRRGFWGTFDRPSECAIVGTEDGTVIDVTSPNASLNGRPVGQTFRIGLNRGETYFLQASLNGPQDVTGTEVLSTKPVAVFSGNMRTSVPTSVGNYRDLLVEQMPPLESWSDSAIVPPLFAITPSVPYKPVIRVVAAFDNTSWSVNGEAKSRLEGGVPVEVSLDEKPYVIEASGPILVAQYEHSVGERNDSTLEIGDPFMMVIPAQDQYDSSYAFQAVPHEEFTDHFVNVVIPTDATESLQIDSVRVSAEFQQVPGTRFSFAQIRISEGAHTAHADEPFGLFSYGYGEANSYGYPGGAVYRTLLVDYQHPYVNISKSCHDVEGVAIDDRITDTGIDSLYVIEEGTRNVAVDIHPFISGADTVRYSATLVDKYQDGIAEVRVIDSGGRSVRLKTPIPGFTLGVVGHTASSPYEVTDVGYNGEETCLTFELENYGSFERTITAIDIDGTGETLQSTVAAPLTLAAGETRTLELCFSSDKDTVFNIELFVGDSCTGRDLIDFTFHSIQDTTAPRQLTFRDSCSGQVELSFVEPSAVFYGIVDVQFIDTVNARVSVTPGQAGLPTDNVSLVLTPVDPYQDMVYAATLVDLAGNRAIVSDTIGGFTLAAYNRGTDDRLSERVGAAWRTDSLAFLFGRCDSALLTNYGSKTVTLSTANMLDNRAFSVPPAQFPIVLDPGDSAYLAVCLEGRHAGLQRDTLVVRDECGRLDRIAIQSPVDYGYGAGADDCGQTIAIQAYAPAKRTFISTPVPNPSTGSSVRVDIGLVEDSDVSIEVLDANGHRALQVMVKRPVTAGIHRLHFDPSRLASGLYFCRMITSDGTYRTAKLVVAE